MPPLLILLLLIALVLHIWFGYLYKRPADDTLLALAIILIIVACWYGWGSWAIR